MPQTERLPVGSRLLAYLQLLRPANVVTAWADILAGFAAATLALGAEPVGEALGYGTLGWLLLATTGLYGGGIVLNDVFDAALDAQERPERPIPSGRASRRGAALFGGSLLFVGVAAAALVSLPSAVLAAAIALGTILYDARAKHHALLGPLTMGGLRGGNLLLGVSALPAALGGLWFLALIPVAYIAAITAVSRGEVHGGTRSTGLLALVLVGLVLGSTLALELLPGYAVLEAAPFALLFAWRVVPPFVKAARMPRPEPIRAAVRAGVLSLILLDATLAAGFAGWPYGLVVLALLPLSLGLARLFAVT